ncbi:hypothetical protein [Nocardia noduli]|uniref:hypothetical protein n=1 Tax=Nocardia noduli TaxID=2815722 RepID=UPI0020B281F9|nr:hypothetical protein [Nocardia noduli]
MSDAPLYCLPPSTEDTRSFIRAGALAMIASPGQGNSIEDAYHRICFDNGVYTGRYPGDERYLAWLGKHRRHAERCLFAVAPDVVGNHFATRTRSRDMLRRIRDLGLPVAYAAQNFMDLDAWDLWDEIDCLFIAGDDEWKLGPAAANLAAVASSLGKWVHMGRVNSFSRFHYARLIGCDSVDGTHLTYAPDVSLAEILSWIRKSDLHTQALSL